MDFFIPMNADRVLILGAGASVDYGLPVWKDLGVLMKEKIESDVSSSYKHKEKMVKWIDKVQGKEKGPYATLDECIYHESSSADYKEDGVDIENELFGIMREVFDGSYKGVQEGWIQELNDKIFATDGYRPDDKLAFINYNYDHVLEDNFLNFGHVSAKDRLRKASHLSYLSIAKARELCPHGALFSNKATSHILRQSQTLKTGVGGLIDAISCHEDYTHTVYADNYDRAKRNIYILGLGGGLEINLKKINFHFPTAEVHVTIQDEKLLDSVPNFLSAKFKVRPEEIKIYNDCEDLIRKCF